MKYITGSEAETTELGCSLAAVLKAGDVIAFTGDLGSGKTAFIRGIAAGLGLTSRVSSPTFTIVNEYPGKIPLFHFDMYRLQNSDELFDIGWEDYLERGGICAVEWSENVFDAFDSDTVFIEMEKLTDTDRSINIILPAGREFGVIPAPEEHNENTGI